MLLDVVLVISTVRMLLDVTPRLSEAGRLIIKILMFTGRLVPLTLIVLLTTREQHPRVTYLEDPVLIS